MRVLDKNSSSHPSVGADCVKRGILAAASNLGHLGAQDGLAHIAPKSVKLQRNHLLFRERAGINNLYVGSALLVLLPLAISDNLVPANNDKFRAVLVDPKAVRHSVKLVRQAADNFSNLNELSVKAQSPKFLYVNLED